MPTWTDGSVPHNGTLNLSDLFLRVVDPSGTPSDEAITAGEILDKLIFHDVAAVLADEDEVVLTHNLNDSGAVLLAAFPSWNAGQPWIVAQDADTITIGLPNPPSGTESITFAVRPVT